MGATTRYGLRWPDGTTSPNLRTLLKNLAEDIEGRLAALDDGTFHKGAGDGLTAGTGGVSTTGSVGATGFASAAAFRFGATGNEVVIQPAPANAVEFLNPGAGLWATLKAAAFATQSSLRYKEKIRATRYGLADLLQLRPVDYHYKAGHGDPDIPQTGLIAEDVAGIYPEAVTFDDDGQPDGIDYAKLTPLLIRAVHELAERLERIEQEHQP